MDWVVNTLRDSRAESAKGKTQAHQKGMCILPRTMEEYTHGCKVHLPDQQRNPVACSLNVICV